jgi:putative ABC transport system permease protein
MAITFFRDLRHALRTLTRSPAYALACVPVLALGIGANAAIFSVVHSVILKPLPYTDPARLVFLWERFPSLPDPPFGRIPVARKNYLEWQRQNAVFANMAAFRQISQSETSAGQQRHVSVVFTSASLFPMLGVQASIGRLFTGDEEHQNDDRPVVLADSYFQQRFNGDRNALGRILTLNGIAYTIVGVMPPKFHLPATSEGSDQLKPDVWAPLSSLGNTAEDDARRQLLVSARLKPGISLAQARTEMAGIAQRLGQTDPNLNQGWTVSIFPFETEDSSPTLHRALFVLLAAVGFLLLIACANLANLTLARATLRSREIAVRLALGATRARIVSQLVSESFIVSVAGAACGLLLAHWCVKLMLALQPPEIQRPELIEINLPVFAFAAAAAVLTTLLFGLAPSLAASNADVNSALKAGGWGSSAPRFRSRQFLIVIEVALALVMVTGAGLMLRSFHELTSTGIGFQTAHLTTADIDLPEKRYPDGARQSRFFRELMDRAGSIPGVTACALVDNLPLHRVKMLNFFIAGRPEPSLQSLPMSDVANVSPQYFSTIGLRLAAGRFFTESDLALAEKDNDSVAIVNRAFARQFLNAENPLGKRLLGPDKKHAFEIVGVVDDYRPMGVENGTRPQIFWPDLKFNSGTLIVRTKTAQQSVNRDIQNAVHAIDKEITASEIRPLEDRLDEWQSQRKFNTLLLAIFAGLALVLAMMGIYGVLSNQVASRVREIGIRMAIGARPAEIGLLVVRQTMIPVIVGIAIGLAGSLALSRFLEALLFQVHPRDPVTLALASATILIVSPVAIYLPVRRATRVDCTVALREE